MSKSAFLLALSLALLPLVAGCGSAKTPDGDDSFKVKFETSVGDVMILVHSDWAPRGAKRFRDLVEAKYFDGCRFFRVIPGFVAQFGLNGDPAVSSQWNARALMDEPVMTTNATGTLTYAMSGPDTRTTQLFINLADNPNLDAAGFSPFAEVVGGMDKVLKINARHGEQPNQGRIQFEGNAYLEKSFPDLDYIVRAVIVE